MVNQGAKEITSHFRCRKYFETISELCPAFFIKEWGSTILSSFLFPNFYLFIFVFKAGRRSMGFSVWSSSYLREKR